MLHDLTLPIVEKSPSAVIRPWVLKRVFGGGMPSFHTNHSLDYREETLGSGNLALQRYIIFPPPYIDRINTRKRIRHMTLGFK